MHVLKRQTAAATGHRCQSAGKTHFGTFVALVVRKVELFSPNADGKASVFPSSPSSSPHQFKAGTGCQAPLPSAPHVPRDRCCLALLSCVFSWSIFLEGGCQRGFQLSVHKTVRAGRTVLVGCFSVFCLSFTVLTFRRSGRGGRKWSRGRCLRHEAVRVFEIGVEYTLWQQKLVFHFLFSDSLFRREGLGSWLEKGGLFVEIPPPEQLSLLADPSSSCIIGRPSSSIAPLPF